MNSENELFKELIEVDENIFENIIRKGNFKLCQAFINARVNVNEKFKFNYTALMIACQHNYKDIVEILIKAGANINDYSDNKNSVLMFACGNGYYDNNKKLIKKTNISDQLDIIKMLIIAGANINDKNINGLNALYYAQQNDQKEIKDFFELVVEYTKQNGQDKIKDFFESLKSKKNICKDCGLKKNNENFNYSMTC